MPVHLRHWEFFFVLAAATGLYALHALGAVDEGEGSAQRVLVQDLVMEAAAACAACPARQGCGSAPGLPWGA
jgi:hypothetical protein